MRKRVYLVGVGPGSEESMTAEARQAIADSGCLLGAARMLSSLGALTEGKECRSLIKSDEIAEYLRGACLAEPAAVILSGDVGFYSGAKRLYQLLSAEEFEVVPLCGISSLTYFCARLKTSWDDAAVLSAHGRSARVVNGVMNHSKLFLLTGGEGTTAGELCALLNDKGLGNVMVHVGQNLSYPREEIVSGTAAELAGRCFDSLAVMLVENPAPLTGRSSVHGLEDSLFTRGEVPMTKREIRSIALSMLAPSEDDVCWDVGAGTGSVSVELGLICRQGQVYAVERGEEALKLIETNRKAFGTYHLEIVAGAAPEALLDLPAPDRVFIGGSGKQLKAVLSVILDKNPFASVVVTAIALETAYEAVRLLEEFRFQEVEIVQAAVSRGKKAGNYYMMMGQNPVFVIGGKGPGTKESKKEATL